MSTQQDKELAISQLRNIQILVKNLIGTINEDTANKARAAIERVITELRTPIYAVCSLTLPDENTNIKLWYAYNTHTSSMVEPSHPTRNEAQAFVDKLNKDAVAETEQYLVTEWLIENQWRVFNHDTGSFANPTIYNDRAIAQAEADRLNGLNG